MMSPDDEHEVRDLGRIWDTAWNSHDVELLASLVTPGIDFIHDGGGWLSGRDMFHKYHAGAHATHFNRTTYRTHGILMRSLTPDICLVHGSWSRFGEAGSDVAPRHVRRGIFTWIVRRNDMLWLIDAAHYTGQR
jgi:uncharacterized protein (TIGR02246 family)